MKTLALLVFFSYLPMINEINGQITKKTDRARVVILADDIHVSITYTVQGLSQFSLTDFTFHTNWRHTGRL